MQPPQPQEPLDNEVLLLAMLEAATALPPAPDGTMGPEAKAAVRQIAGMAQQAAPGPPAALSESFGTEPPGPGWRYDGGGRWVKEGAGEG